ncbi:hypothetical protein FBZ93_103605 [Bradyrhizobium macuxiense]|uniref:Uncharacterized protein n=2 Tax=Bradyrhizobium macuxiense TaxID=1755647 RepID=A0A560MES9_9BRAD|nr:hypothetical protein FBZ93_103605 [Bradyrhizobium macuxiense]
MLLKYGYICAHTMDQIDEICIYARKFPDGTFKKNPPLGASNSWPFLTVFQNVDYLAKELEMTPVTDQSGRLKKQIEILDPPMQELVPGFIELRVRLEEGLRRKEFLFIPEDMAKLYNDADPRRGAAKGIDPFELGDKFKETHADIASAARCLALGEGTASVFHLMRALEFVVKKLSGRLKITVTHKTPWRVLTNSMDGKIKKMDDDTPAKKKKKNQWELACTNLHHVGSVWRNETMHPSATYTPRQAMDVFDACRVLMNSLARL